jgi:SAM-dependent methyltransferase
MNPSDKWHSVKIVKDAAHGYSRLDPVPDPADLDAWYRDRYYGLISAGGRAPDIKKMMEGAKSAAQEIGWLQKSLWKDVLDILRTTLGEQARLLDFGCGLGQFLTYCRETTGWHVAGVEPSDDAATRARDSGLHVYSSLEECIANEPAPFDAVVSLNVLEHLPDPARRLDELARVLAVGSVLAVMVPNDFSALQKSAQHALGCEPWWIAVPDHINYFNFESLCNLLSQRGFQVFDQLGTFPMEMFLLFGDHYVGNPELGAMCHRKRVAFETSIPADLRRSLYRAFATVGVGRECLVFARKVSE